MHEARYVYRIIKTTAFASPRKGRPFAEVAVDPTRRSTARRVSATSSSRKCARRMNPSSMAGFEKVSRYEAPQRRRSHPVAFPA